MIVNSVMKHKPKARMRTKRKYLILLILIMRKYPLHLTLITGNSTEYSIHNLKSICDLPRNV